LDFLGKRASSPPLFIGGKVSCDRRGREDVKRGRGWPYGGQLGTTEIGARPSHAVWQPLGPDGQARLRAIGKAGLAGQFLKSWAPSLIMMEVMALAPLAAGAGASVSSPAADVKRTASERP
jgi:hypothetical protein